MALKLARSQQLMRPEQVELANSLVARVVPRHIHEFLSRQDNLHGAGVIDNGGTRLWPSVQ